ncbi:ABC transporter ATP-binding protein [Amorphus sp. 3PC139-8]|uniref:ABC transporter ATP-binding protein n=1 Tax=Amorphus sp. 3PC139-8 TaxID=2735676 RepID=UPI00345D2A52
MSGDQALSIRGLDVSYGAVKAVSGVEMTLPIGAIVAVLGPNGAGKTTLLSAVAGSLPYGGTVDLGGEDLSGLSIEERFRRGICLVPEQRELFGSMSVADNLLVGGFVRQRQGRTEARSEREKVYQMFPRLQERRHQRASTLSGGERQMLALGRALMGQPDVLLLDEPSLGLSPLIIKDMFAIIERLRDVGHSILLVEQNARMALKIADYAYVLEQGKVRLEGKAADLAQDERVIATYLGGAAADAG